MRQLLSFFAFALLVLIACTTPTMLEPKVGPGTDYPCGIHGRSCGGGMCCDEGDDCGKPGSSCPAGMCCFTGGEDELGAHRPYPQRPMVAN